MTTATVARRPAADLWSALREAVRGSRQDFTEGPVGRAILLLAVPMVLEMVLESVFAVTDVFFVSRLGADAVATVGLTESLMALVYAVAVGVSIGVTATVARRTGEKDPDGAARAAVQGIALGVALAAAIGVTGALLAPKLLALLGASPEVIAIGHGYTRILLGGSAVVLFLFLINAAFRGAGDAAVAMRVLWFASAMNIVLGPCLIFGLGPFPRLGVTGAAIATTTGRGLGVLVQFVFLCRPGGRLTIRRRHLRIDPAAIWRLVRLSASGVLQMLIGTASWIGLVRIVALFGSGALAGYTIGIRIIIFALLPSWGLSNAAATMVGQGLGARKPDRAERAVWLAAAYNLVFLTAIGIAFVALAEPIVRLFTTDPAVAPVAVRCLRLVSFGFPLYAYGMVLTQSFNGAGDTWTPTLLNLVCFWLWEIPLAWLLAVRFGFGPPGAFGAITAAFSALALLSVGIFRRGHWKLRTV
ncbi:MAG TPA: MATE family efflux transporter [Gemmatimonadales bacterium]|nr:MATE family efflux transporter [Gemmatimonadales bacterium]